MKAVYLIPKGSYQTQLRSDTLWGVLCWGISTLYGEQVLEDMLSAAEAGNPEFTISSTFPFYSEKNAAGEEATHRFYPMPLNISAQSDPPYDTIEEYRKRKKIKKINYLSETDFKSALAGNLRKINLLSSSSAQVKPSIGSTVVAHNTIDRISLSTLQKKPKGSKFYLGQLFHNEEFSVKIRKQQDKEGTEITEQGLFFLVRGNTDKIEAVLRWFRHHGIGANASAGKGTFDSRVEDFSELTAPDKADALLNLSLFKPTEQEAALYTNSSGKNAYQLVYRGGKVNYEDKPKVPCFKEGSVLYPEEEIKSDKVFGQVFRDEKDYKSVSHSVYRNFLGFMLKMKG